MIQTYDHIEAQIRLINSQIEGDVFIQKIYSSSRYISIALRFKGKTKYFYFGRGHGYEGIWLSDKQIPSFLRKRDRFLEYLRKHISSSRLISVEADEKDRIFAINYHKWGRVNKIFIFYRARNCFFVHSYFDEKEASMKVFRSWDSSRDISDNTSFDEFDRIGRTSQERHSGKELKEIEILLEEEMKEAKGEKKVKKKEKFIKRKIKNITQDLDKVSSMGKLNSLIEQTSDFSKLDKKLQVDGIKINFKSSDHYKRRDEVYEKIKSLKRAESILESRLAQVESELSQVSNLEFENTLKAIGPKWGSSKNSKKEEKKGEGYKTFSIQGFIVGVGLSAQGNDNLRKQWAKKDDYWFHLDSQQSPHIILKLGDASLTQDKIHIAAAALKQFGNFASNEINLIYTQVKNLKGVKGVPGTVNYKKEKHIKVINFTSWNNLFNPSEN